MHLAAYRLTGTRKSGTNKSVPLLCKGKQTFPGEFLVLVDYDETIYFFLTNNIRLYYLKIIIVV